MAKPGIILRRRVGTTGPFREHAQLPSDLAVGSKPVKAARKPKDRKSKKDATPPVGKAAEGQAALAYEREQKKRARTQGREEAARQKERERRQEAVDKAQTALDRAESEHSVKSAAIRAEVETLERRLQAEDARWGEESKRLRAALKRARG